MDASINRLLLVMLWLRCEHPQVRFNDITSEVAETLNHVSDIVLVTDRFD